MISSALLELIATVDAPTFQDVEQELARSLSDLNLARETLIGAQLMLSQCEPRQLEQESAISCALALIGKGEGLVAIVRAEIARARAGKDQQGEEDANVRGDLRANDRS